MFPRCKPYSTTRPDPERTKTPRPPEGERGGLCCAGPVQAPRCFRIAARVVRQNERSDKNRRKRVRPVQVEPGPAGEWSAASFGAWTDVNTTLYTSMFRYDDELLVNPHIWGQPASANPLLHLRRVDAAGWFDNYARSFDAVWAAARPWTPDQEGPSSHGQD